MAQVGPRVLNYLSDSKVKTPRIQIDGFTSALYLYFLDNGRYPSTSEGLATLVRFRQVGRVTKGFFLEADPRLRALTGERSNLGHAVDRITSTSDMFSW